MKHIISYSSDDYASVSEDNAPEHAREHAREYARQTTVYLRVDLQASHTDYADYGTDEWLLIPDGKPDD
ncbi:hypothetical protein GVv1_46690 (plasmid) [Enterobacter pseudoroggenkampii]